MESVGIASAGICVAVLLTQRSFETSLVLTAGTSEPQQSSLFVQRLKEAAESVSATSAVVASVERSAPNELRISCRSEQPRVARQACERIAGEATKPPQLAQLVSSSTLPHLASDDQTMYYALLALLAALLWFALRLRQGRRARAGISDPALEGWHVESPAQNGATELDIAESVTTSEIRALSRAQPANDASFGAIDPDSDRTMLHPRPQPAPGRTAATQELRLAPRIIFRVGGNPFEPDRQVLTEPTLALLRELCAQLLAADLRQRVVRIASGVSSRYAKTQVTAQLSAMLAAGAELPVLALEGDIDAPALHKAMHLEAPLGLGLSEQLQRMSRQERADGMSVMRVEGNLHALVESRTSSPDALGLPQFEQMVESLRAQYDFIVVDGPVLDTWPDSGHLANCVDDVVMVAAAGTRLRDTHALATRHFDQDIVLSVVTAGDWVATG